MAIDCGQGRIYIIRNTVNGKCYVGSTVRTLAQRMSQHRSVSRCVDTAHTSDAMPLIQAMRELGEEHFFVELHKDYPCERKEQLHAEEGKCIRELNTIVPNGYNVCVAGRPRAQWFAENSETLKIKHREYLAAHATEVKARKQKYYETHRKELTAKCRDAHAANKDVRNANRRKYRKEHIEAESVTKRAYYEANKDELRAKVKEYHDTNKQEINAKRRAAYNEAKLAAPPVAALPPEEVAKRAANAKWQREFRAKWTPEQKDANKQKMRENYVARKARAAAVAAPEPAEA